MAPAYFLVSMMTPHPQLAFMDNDGRWPAPSPREATGCNEFQHVGLLIHSAQLADRPLFKCQDLDYQSPNLPPV